jgi:hypothetical protein
MSTVPRPRFPARTRQRPTGLVALLTATATGSAGLAAGGTAGPLIAATLRLPIGAPVIALMAGSAVTVSIVGTWRSPNRALAAGYLLGAFGAAGAIVAAAAGLSWGFVSANAFLGAATTAVFFARYAAADLAHAGERGQAVGALLFAAAVGAIGGPLLLAPSGAVAHAVGLPARTGLYLVAAVAFPAVAVMITGPAPPATGFVGPPAPATTPVRAVDGRVRAYLVLATANAGMVAVMTTAPVALDRRGTASAAIGGIVAMHVFAMFAPAPFAGWFCDRAGSWTVISAAGGLYAACAAILLIAPRLGTSLAAASLVTLGLGWNFAVVGASTALAAAGGSARLRGEVVGEVFLSAGAAVGAATAGTFPIPDGLHSASKIVGVVAGLFLLAALARSRASPAGNTRAARHDGDRPVPPRQNGAI